jgi:predicted metal-dependent peptidase
MGKSSQALRKKRPFEEAFAQLRQHYLLGSVAKEITVRTARNPGTAWRVGSVLRIESDATFVVNDEAKLSTPQWLAVLAIATLVLALGAPRRLAVPSPHADLAAQLAALHWWRTLKLGVLPERMELAPELLQWGRLPLREIVARLKSEPEHELHDGCWTLNASLDEPLLVSAVVARRCVGGTAISRDLEQVFAHAMVDNARRALRVHDEASRASRDGADPNSHAARARRWLITHYPLLGGLLTQFELVEDAEVCRRMDIRIAAIHVGAGEIYVNPACGLSLEQSKFVVAHEILHAGLCHASRRHGRDADLWNVACDFVINDWLVTMQVGVAPDGLLFDEELRGWSADDIYLRLAADLRVRRRLCTLRGDDVDLLDERPDRGFTDREEFCRRALAQGLDHHQSGGRGLLPAGLVEAIRTLSQPPIPWQAALAEWMRERFPLIERRRSYARPSRRQSTTPDTPRPRFVAPDDERTTRTFGVIVDSSASMERIELGKALGAIVSYAQAQDVREVRLVYCDAQPYDEGFVAIEALASRVSVRGRGGTVLQPAVELLQTRRDFPKAAPILLITDGLCEDDLQVARDHAFLLTTGGRLPFVTRKPVFRMT